MWIFDFCNNAVRFQDRILKRRRRIPRGRSSKGEHAVAAVLNRHDIDYTAQYSLGYCMHVDFAIHHNNRILLIEYDGRQHYRPVKHFGGYLAFFKQRLRDIVENLECRHRGIPLLRIRYNAPLEDIEPMVIDFITKNA